MSVRPRRFDRLIPAYLERTLSDRKRRWFENRLRDSEPCRVEMAAYRRMREEVGKVAVDYPDPYAWEGFTSTLRQRIEQDARLGTPGRARWSARGFEVAAGAVGGAVCGTVCAFAVVYFGLSSGLVPAVGGGQTPPLTALATLEGSSLTAEVIRSSGAAYLVEFGAQDGSARVATTMDAEQLVALLRASGASADMEAFAEWAEPSPTYESRQGPIDLYGSGDSNVFLVSSSSAR